MVRTRQSGEVETDSPPRFLALEGKGSRKSRYQSADGEDDSDNSGIVYKHEEHSIFEDKVVESRLRPRVGPTRAYNYVYEDSSDDELLSSRRRRSRVVNGDVFSSHRRRRRESRKHSSEEEIEEEERKLWRTSRRRQTRELIEQDQEDEVDGAHASGEDEEEEDFNNSALVRRSKRLREKPVRYRTKSELEDSHDKGNGDNISGVDRGKRRRSDDVPPESNDEYEDMYSRVKRARHKKNEADSQDQSASNSEASHDEADKHDSENETEQRRSYSLREQRRMPQRYVAPIEETRRKPKPQSFFRETPPRRVKKHTYRSPAHRSTSRNRRRHALNGSSSSTSSDSDSGGETTDEQRFSRRKAKSMAKARSRIMPLNFTKDTVPSSSVLKDRVRAGASLADVDPMEIDRSVTFESVGGLQKHIRTLKEMIVFPLLYPEFYERFKVAPSRGVLFYGPPGTGKTLVARALANECSRGEQRVAFFMRKGADCLSKWVGEAERQLRLLFDKAYEMRPSIIFFDEIDGLAPVRSSRQDQIHSSIVSTLLALMDGIDSRGEIVVIGATNRIDAIDPALRRPGRFDREFHFPLPNVQDRKKILRIHTKHWEPSLRPEFISELAEKCAGYCGADIKCLVTEATQNALRRHYPQIYTTSDKLQLDVTSITLTARDFTHALSTIIPAAQRAAPNPAAALEPSVRPLLKRSLMKLQTMLSSKFPFAKLENTASTSGQGCNSNAPAEDKASVEVELASDEDEDLPSIFAPTGKGSRLLTSHPVAPATFLGFSRSSSSFPTLFRPRLLVSGTAGQGQTVHLAPAALHLVEHLPVHTLSSSTLFAASAKMPEEACATVFHEAKRTAPSVIYMPYVNELWGVVTDSLRVTFLSLVRGMNPSTPILLFATSETPYKDLDGQLKALFSMAGSEVVEVEGPTAEERRQFFADLILNQTVRPPPTRKQAENKLATEGIVRLFPEWKPSQKRIRADQNSNQALMEICVPSSGTQAQVGKSSRNTGTAMCTVASDSDVERRRRNSDSVAHDLNSVQLLSAQKTGTDPKQFNSCSHSQKVNMPQCMELHIHTKKSTTTVTAEHDAVPSTSKSVAYPGSKSQQLTSARSNSILPNRLNLPSHKRFKLPLQTKKLKKDYFVSMAFGWKTSSSTKSHANKVRHGSKGFNRSRSNRTKFGGARNYNQSACHDVLSSAQCVSIHKHRYPSRKAAFNKAFPCQPPVCKSKRKSSSDNKCFVSRSWDIQGEAMRVLQQLPKAPPPEPRKLTEREQKKLEEQEEDTIRELRIFLRDILSKLGREKKFSIFAKPVDIDEVPDYYEIIKKPMDLSTMMAKIDLHQYTTASAFMDDILLICSNALEYNPDRGPTDRAIRHRACALRDTAQALFKAELDPDFERICQEITQSRKRRGVDSTSQAPAFYRTRPPGASLVSSDLSSAFPSSSTRETVSSSATPHPEASRFSRRVRGIAADKIVSLEEVEKSAQLEKSLLSKKKRVDEDILSAGDSAETPNITDADKTEEKDSTGDASCHAHLEAADMNQEATESSGNNSVKSPPTTISHSGKHSKTSCDSRHLSASTLKKMSQRKRCPWLATKRRKRYSSTPGQRPKGANPSSDTEMVSGDDPSHVAVRRNSRQDSQQSDHDVSPQSAANPENVQLSSAPKTPAQCVTKQSSAGGSGGDASAIQDSAQDPGPADCSEHNQNNSATTSPSDNVDNVTPSNPARRRLEEELIAVTSATDSGLGSSVESNGDSRDSLEHNSNNSHPLMDQESQDSGAEVDGTTSVSKVSGLKAHRTRSRTQDPVQENALRELEAEKPVIQVDKDRLRSLLDHIVHSTENFTVELLQKLYSMLSCAVYNSRMEYDKTRLVKEMEQLVERFCRETDFLVV